MMIFAASYYLVTEGHPVRLFRDLLLYLYLLISDLIAQTLKPALSVATNLCCYVLQLIEPAFYVALCLSWHGAQQTRIFITGETFEFGSVRYHVSCIEHLPPPLLR